jgi:hypothetical protein
LTARFYMTDTRSVASTAEGPDWRLAFRIPVAAFLVILIFMAGDIWNERQNAEDDAYEALAIRSQLASTALEASLTGIDSRLKEIAELRLATTSAQLPDLPLELVNRRSQIPSAVALMTIDAAGRVDAHTDVPAIGFDASQREHYRVHADGVGIGNRAHIAKPFLATINLHMVTVSRPILDSQGHFRGVVAAAISMEQLAALLVPARPEDGTLTLIRRDGSVFVHLPEGEAKLGGSIADSPMFKAHIESGNPSSRTRITSAHDAIERFVAIRNLESFPLTVHVGRPAAAVLASWQAKLLPRSNTAPCCRPMPGWAP